MNHSWDGMLHLTQFRVTIARLTLKGFLVSTAKSNIYAILMGDLVGSEKAKSVKTVHRVFNNAIKSVSEAHGANIASPLTITLGNEFQGLLKSLQHAWDITSDLRLRLLVANVSCRFVIGTAELETPLNKTRAWNMMGGGFAAARDKLNDKRSDNAYRFSLPGEQIIESLLDAIGASITQIEREWTFTQLKYYSKVQGSKRTNEVVANRLGVTPRSLYKVLHAARAEFHKRQSEVLRRALGEIDKKYGKR